MSKLVSLKYIINELNLEVDNLDDKDIFGLNTLTDASSGEVSFFENKKYLEDLKDTKAAAVFVTEQYKDDVPSGTLALVTDTPYIALAKTSKFFAPNLIELDGNDPVRGAGTIIMENVHLGYNTIIGENCTIMAGSYIGDNVTIGDNSIIYPNVTIYRDCKIGSNTTIHSGTVIGSDGFGFATDKKTGTHIKIYQNGNVVVGNDVEIGANCTIDRAVFASTIIEDMVRIDNLVHIAHNCRVGHGSILVTQVGLSGSTILNEYVVMGGQSGTTGHLEVAPFTTIAARGVVSKSIHEPKKQWAGFPLIEHKSWLKLQAKIQRLIKG